MRSEVSGVRSSWPASATSRRCRSREAAARPSIALNAVASRAISSSPSTGAARGPRCGRSPRRRRSAAYGPQAVARDRPAGDGGADHAARGRTAASRCRAVEQLLLRVQRLGEHERLAVVGRHGGDAVVLAVRDDRADATRSRCRPRRRAPARRGACRGPSSSGCDVAARRDEDDADVGRTERPGGTRSTPGPSSGAAVGRLAGPVEQRSSSDACICIRTVRKPPSATSATASADRDRGQQDHPAGQRPPVVPARSTGQTGAFMSPSARSRRHARCGSAAARPRPRSCGAGSRRRPRASWRVVGKS